MGAMDLEAVVRVARDVKAAASSLTPSEARYLVGLYYTFQEHRVATDNQVRSLAQAEEPHSSISFLAEQARKIEDNVRSMLDAYSASQAIGSWARSICGIGPVIAAGLMAHIDIEKAPTVGHIWRFAGLDPTVTWAKGQARPFNARLKVICFHIGESFVKVSNNDNDIYGKVYVERKSQEQAKNEAGAFADQAARALSVKRFGAKTEARKHYEAGRLPPAHIHARAKRYAVKLFLSHYHHVSYRLRYGCDPPSPYVLVHGGHAHFIAPPNIVL